MPLLHERETGRILGACVEVHRELGPGFLESVYHESLQLELRSRDIPFVSQPALSLTYKGRSLEARFQPDFVCFDLVIVEIKAVDQLHQTHYAQTLNYLKATGLPVALLVNFGCFGKLQNKRFVSQRLP